MTEPPAFLTEAWARSLADALNRDPAVQKIARKRSVSFVFEISDAANGVPGYVIAIGKGGCSVRLDVDRDGDAVPFACTVDVAARVAQGTLNGRDAVMSKQMTTSASLIAIIKNASTLEAVGKVQAALPTTY